ncbi:MAG: hypothetical protein KA419_10490 [Acidobacteria bacterium]|nr:hypothetical protein [Acidobacteriota bacterium]
MARTMTGICLVVLGMLMCFEGCGGGNKVSESGGAVTATDGPRGTGPESLALVDPAVLVTKADAEAALGASVKDPEVVTNPMGQKILTYTAVTEGRQAGQVQVSVNQTVAMPEKMRRNGQSAPKLFDDSASLLGEVKPVPNLGEKAFWGGTGLRAGAGLHVLKGEVYFTVGVSLGSEEADFTASEKLARQALERLK